MSATVITLEDPVLARLRDGGEQSVRLFIQTCFDRYEFGGMDAVAPWIARALPLLPEDDKQILVTSLMEALATGWTLVADEVTIQ